MKKQPFLSNFPLTVFATAKRRFQAVIRSAREEIIRDSISDYAILFKEVLPADFLNKIDPTQRQRFFGHIPMFWAWLAQIFERNASCSKALGLIQTWCQASNLPVPKSGTGGFCQARIRMNEDFLKQITLKTIEALSRNVRPMDLWHGHPLKSIDGSSVTLMDTAANQKIYPQPSGQKTGCGFPCMGIMAVLNHSHGGWEGFETSIETRHDARMAPKMLKYLEEGDLLLGDRAFCSYEFIALLRQKKVHYLMRLHQARHRKIDWRKGKKISPTERLITWKKPDQQPPKSELSKEEWAKLPSEMTVRYIKVRYKNRARENKELIVVSDLTDTKKYKARELSDLYAERWQIELKFRDLKTTLGMEKLEVKTPSMAHKTLWMTMIAYNLIRYQMQQAAIESSRPLYEMSFKGTLDLVNSIRESLRPLTFNPRKLMKRLREIVLIGTTKIIDIRPGRQEPRALKKRHKNYQLLTKPRHKFQEIQHRSRYRKHA